MASTPSQDILTSNTSTLKNEQASNGIFANQDYNPIQGNWFTAKPYGFKFTDKNNKVTTMFLPISPGNLTINTNFATNMVSTLYGTVEEHSPVRYYDISIEGTTGMAPKYVDPVTGGLPQAKLGRSTFTVKQTLGPQLLGGFFSQTLGKLEKIVSDTKALFGKPPEVSPGVYVDQSGYIAFHNLYRFLLQYKKDASGVDPGTKGKVRPEDAHRNSIHPLIFFNYKDCNQYKVVIRSFTLRRDKEDPMLYNYSITMRGYDLSDINDTASGRAAKTNEDMLGELGLNGVDGSTYLGTAKKSAVSAKNILGSVASGINLFGR